MGTALIIIVFAALAVAGIYVFLIMPRVVDRADMDMLTVDYAHRGLWGDKIPENSAPAFVRAVKGGYGIELDIQLSKDNKIMVFHDYDLKRMCGIDKKLSELTCAELKNIRLGNSEYTIPTLAEVLNLVDGRVPLLIELKGESGDVRLCRIAAEMLDKYHGAFCVESFNPLLLRWFKKYRPRYARGQLVTKLNKKNRNGSAAVSFGLSHMLFNLLSRPDFIAVDGKIRRSFMITVCKKAFGAKIFVWTVKNQKDYQICRKDGMHTIFEKIIPQRTFK